MIDRAHKIMCPDSMILYFLISAGRLVRALAATQPPGRCRFYKCRIDLDTSSGIHHFNQYRNEEITMASTSAIDSLGALAQAHRLALFRLLGQAAELGSAPCGERVCRYV